ncbi:haloacid dehalogenase-like hydrolase, partial [Musa troglodytarum]
MRETMDAYISEDYAAARRRERTAKKAKEAKQSEDSTARVSKEDEKRKTILAHEAIKEKKAAADGGSVEEDVTCSRFSATRVGQRGLTRPVAFVTRAGGVYEPEEDGDEHASVFSPGFLPPIARRRRLLLAGYPPPPSPPPPVLFLIRWNRVSIVSESSGGRESFVIGFAVVSRGTRFTAMADAMGTGTSLIAHHLIYQRPPSEDVSFKRRQLASCRLPVPSRFMDSTVKLLAREKNPSRRSISGDLASTTDSTG